MKVDQPLRVLHLEDDARDAELVRDLLEAGGDRLRHHARPDPRGVRRVAREVAST